MCTPEAVIYPEDQAQPRLEASYVNGLDRVQFFAKCLRDAATLPGWADIPAPLRLASTADSLHTVALLAEAAMHPAFLERFGFVLETADAQEVAYVEHEVRCELPIVANLGATGVIAWLDVDAILFETEEETSGLKIVHVHRAQLEAAGRFDKRSEWPELVVHETWPTVALAQPRPRQTSSEAASWGVGLRMLHAD